MTTRSSKAKSQPALSNMIAHHNNKANARVSTVQLTASRCSAAHPTLSSRYRSVTSDTHRLIIKHVKMVYAAKNKALMASSSRRLSLPQHLSRPTPREIRSATLEALGSGYKGIHPRLVREQLLVESTSLVSGLHSADFSSVVRNPIPAHVTVPVHDFLFGWSAICPTHVLALSTTITSESGVSSTQLSLYPIHELVFAANCSSFPTLPRSSAATEEGSTGTSITLPVVNLNIPSAWTFPIIQSYIYRKDSQALRSALLPEGWDSSVANILKQATTIQDVWKNAVALGVVDEKIVLENVEDDGGYSIYDVIDDSWTQILRALRQKTTSSSS